MELVTRLRLSLWIPWYWPTVLIRATSEAVEPSAGMPVSFSIENTGILKGYSPRYRCYFGHVQGASVQITLMDDASNEVAVADADVLVRNDPVEVTCPQFGVPAIEADVAILVSFRPEFDWRRSAACSRYALSKNAGGQLAWFRKSSAPCGQLATCLNARDVANREYLQAMREYIKGLREGHATTRPTVRSAIARSCLPKD